MADSNNSLFGLSLDEQKNLAEFLQREQFSHGFSGGLKRKSSGSFEEYTKITALPAWQEFQLMFTVMRQMDLPLLYFTCNASKAKGRTRINGEEFINFSTYDYVGLNGHAEVNAAAVEAMELYGTSAGASRLVGGERPPHARLEKAIAAALRVEDAVVFVSGHATNVSALVTLLGPKDAVFHDALAHNSLILGATLSGARRFPYQHNNCAVLETLLQQNRSSYERVVIVTEGLFSMDGTVVDLPGLIELKERYGCFLMVDEAHSLGVLGDTGRGSAEHYNISSADVDIWMGTLSKTLCGCGGFIAGSKELVTLLKFRAPGFVYSVGMPPPIAAASAKALELMLAEPERTKRLQAISAFFLAEAKARGFNTGSAKGYGVIPVILGSSMEAVRISAVLFKRKIYVLPIIYPAVEEGLARLRFFLSSEHTEEDIINTLNILAEECDLVETAAENA
jgi:8-amino-7-oxononanoate synthase